MNTDNIQKLTLHHYGETTPEDRRVTIAPHQTVVCAAEVDDVQVNGRTVRNVTIMFLDGGSVDLSLNHSDLSLLESAIGSFCLG